MALIVLVALLRGGTVGVLLIDRARQALRDDILHSNLATAGLAVSVAAGYMFGVERDARDLAGSSKLKTAAARGDLPLTTPELERWLPQHPDLIGVGIAELAGVTRATGAWGATLMQAIIGLGLNLGLRIVAAGVGNG